MTYCRWIAFSFIFCLSFLPLFSHAGNGCHKLPSTSKCQCSDYTINCTALQGTVSGTEIFTQIRADEFDSLQNLILSGYQFRELPADLFGPDGKKHRKLSKIVLSHNNISVIHGLAFRQAPNLEILDLSYNEISLDLENPGLSENRIFNRLPRLKKLVLTAALDELKHNMTRQILAWKVLFEHGSLSELWHLDLQANGLFYVPSDLICRLPALTHLLLGNNDLTSFGAVKNCFTTVSLIDLSDNAITYLNSSFIKLIEDAEHAPKVNLAGNPFKCDCYLQTFVSWVKKTERLLSPDQTLCFDPEYLENRPVKSLNPDQLSCGTDGMGHIHGVYIIVALALIGLIGLVVCVGYFNHRCTCPDHKLKMHSFAGYAQLQKEEAAQAEFV